MSRVVRTRGLFRWRLALLALAALQPLFAPAAHGQTALKIFPPLPTPIQLADLPDWLRTHTDIAPESVVSIAGGGVVLILMDKGVRTGPDQRTDTVIRREALGDVAADVIGVRSELVRLDLDCAASQYRVRRRYVYSGNALTGMAEVRAPDTSTFPIGPNTDMALLQRAGCDPTYSAWLSPYLNDKKIPLAALAAAPTSRPRQTSGASRILVQVAASPSEAQAQAVLAALVKRFPEMTGLATRVEAVNVRDKVLFRALIVGFSARPSAEAFCARLRLSGRSCWVR